MRSLRKIACRQLAQTIGISTGYLSQLEHGIQLNPDPRLLLDITKALGHSWEPAALKTSRSKW